MVLSNVIVDVTISSRSFVFSQSDVQIPTELTNISGLAVAAFDLIACSLTCLSLGSSLYLMFFSSCRKLSSDRFESNAEVLGL